MTNERQHYCLFGASPFTGNLGVSALCCSVLQAMHQRLPSARPTVFDHGRGIRPARIFGEHSDGGFGVDLCGLNLSRRVYRSDSLANLRFASRWVPRANRVLRRMIQADAWLDISGGDSFTDLYGPGRFEAMAAPKELILRHGGPLVLLPQTYGPFRSALARQRAEQIVRGAMLAYARDPRSYQRLRELAGDEFDPQRHREGVDVAFLLPPLMPEPGSLGGLQPLLADGVPLVGINVSGLIYNDPDAAKYQYGFQADYRQVIHSLIQQILADSDAHVVLVPHVVVSEDRVESDLRACRAAAASLQIAGAEERVHIAPEFRDPRHAKWLISRLDWFCGTRMHATIAALSSGVPTAAIAYSIKTQGVFETCGQGDHVADPRADPTDVVVSRIIGSFQRHSETTISLSAAIGGTKRTAESQMIAVADLLLKNMGRATNRRIR